MIEEKLHATAYDEPFPHLIIDDFYNPEELELIWEELTFYTKPGKLLTAKDFGGVVGKTNSHALAIDCIYQNNENSVNPDGENGVNYRSISNILTVNRKMFTSGVLKVFADIHPCCAIAPEANYDCTKVRYYHNGEYYEPHKDKSTHFLSFSYFYKEPKKFTGGEVYFPEYGDYQFSCYNNSMIILPGWVQHGVKEVSIENSDYYDGMGRYAITNFFSCANNSFLSIR